MFSDPQFWVAVAFIMFILASFNPIRKILSSSLDMKIQEIKNNIEEAENLRSETQETLANIRKKQNEVQKEIEKIHSDTKLKIIKLEKEAKEKLNDQINKKEILTKLRIDQMTREANLIIQKHVSQTAIEAVTNILETKLDKVEKQKMINQSIKDLSLVLKN